MLQIVAREYKVVLDHQMFADHRTAVPAFWQELKRFARTLGVKAKGRFEKPNRRTITFLDTADHSIYASGLVLRRRDDGERVEYTLKCRSPDRYFAAQADLSAAKGLKDDAKFEEDIAAPFVIRFSQSNTVAVKGKRPQTLRDAAAIFPVLGRLRRDGRKCSGKTRLQPVNGLQAFERVFAGPLLKFDDETAKAALILWSAAPKGRPLVAEFSFRYADKAEGFSRNVAELAMEFFLATGRLDWCRPQGRTKTQYVYRSG
jgi:hypothetical protein